MNWISLAKKAYHMAKHVSSLVNTEFKQSDSTPLNGLAVASGTGRIAFAAPAVSQGDSFQTRDGRSILLWNLDFKFSVQIHASATATKVACYLVWDNQPDGALAAYTDVFDSATIFSHLNLDNTANKRFYIMKRWQCVLSSVKPEVMIKYFHKFERGTRSKFIIGGTGSAITDIQSGAVLFLAISDEATNTPTITNSAMRIRFIDN